VKQLLGNAFNRSQVVRAEHGSRVIERLSLILQAKRTAAGVSGQSFAQDERLLDLRGDGDGAPRQPLDCLDDAGERLQWMHRERQRPGLSRSG
jgi:hypothetical protein